MNVARATSRHPDRDPSIVIAVRGQIVVGGLGCPNVGQRPFRVRDEELRQLILGLDLYPRGS